MPCLYVHPCLPDIMAYGELSQVVHFYVDQIWGIQKPGNEATVVGRIEYSLLLHDCMYTLNWSLFHDITMMSISCEWNRICYLHTKFWPLSLWCHSYIILVHMFTTCSCLLKWSSPLVHSFTVTVCASYRGRGLGSTLCKSLVMHKLLVTSQLFENRKSFLLRQFPTVKSGSWPHPMVGRRVSKAASLPPDLVFKNCRYEQF